MEANGQNTRGNLSLLKSMVSGTYSYAEKTVHRKIYDFYYMNLNRSMHGSYLVTRGRVLRAPNIPINDRKFV